MKKLLFSAAAFMLVGAGCYGSSQTVPAPVVPAAPQAQTPPQAQTQGTVPVQATVGTATESVTIQGFAFSPKTITVKKGAKIVFTNDDSPPHTVTADAGAFDSGTIQPGSSYTLDTSSLAAGTYAFHCKIHPMMKATLTVQ